MEPMTSMAATKRRLATGTRLLCVEHTRRPERLGKVATVTRAQKENFAVRYDGDPAESWVKWPGRDRFELVDGDTFRVFPLEGVRSEWMTFRFTDQPQ